MNRIWGIACLALVGAAPAEPISPGDLARRIDLEVLSIPGFDRGNVSPAVEDGPYLRRVMLDLVGHPPTAEHTKAFLADRDPEKRGRNVNELLGSWRFADHWARRFAEALLGDTQTVRADLEPPLASDVRRRLAAGFVRWLALKIHRDRPWGEVVSEMASARGTTDARPELAWKLSFCREGEATRDFGCHAARQLMGINLLCARCHDHPFDRWTTDDHYGMAAFVARLTAEVRPATKGSPVRVEVGEGPRGEARWDGVDGQKGPAIPPRLLTTGGTPKEGESRLDALGRLLADPRHTQLSRMAANRVWAWLLGRGIVHPVDDFNLRYRPLSPKLLEALQRGFDENGRSIKFLVRAICASETYRRSSEGGIEPVRVTFSRGLVRPLSTEQLVSSLEAATRLEPARDLAAARDLSIAFSPPLFRSPCEVTSFSCTPWQALYLRNNEEVWGWIREGGVLARIREGKGTLEEKVDEMFLAALSRRPSEKERRRFTAFFGAGTTERFEDAYWTILNSHEFVTRN